MKRNAKEGQLKKPRGRLRREQLFELKLRLNSWEKEQAKLQLLFKKSSKLMVMAILTQSLVLLVVFWVNLSSL